MRATSRNVRSKKRATSFHPRDMVSDSINPWEELDYPALPGAATSTTSIRLEIKLLEKIDQYAHDPVMPWKTRSDFMRAAVERLLQDVVRIKADPTFEHTLNTRRIIMEELRSEEESKQANDMMVKLRQTLQAMIADGAYGEARAKYQRLLEQANDVQSVRWRERIKKVLKEFAGTLGDGEDLS